MEDTVEPTNSSSRIKMWFSGWPGDFMYYAHANEPFNRFESTFDPVLVPSNYAAARCERRRIGEDPRDGDIPSTRDSELTADPTVIRVPFPDAIGHRYFMYYTGTSHGSIYNSVFFADSSDGVSWTKHDGTNSGKPVPYPVLQVKYRDRIDAVGGRYGACPQSVISTPQGFLLYYLDWTQINDHRRGHIRGVYMVPGGWAPPTDSSFTINLDVGEFDTKLFVRPGTDANRIILVSTDPGLNTPQPHQGKIQLWVSQDRVSFSEPVSIPMAWLTSNQYIRCVGAPSLLGDGGGWIYKKRESAIYLTCGHGTVNDPPIDGVGRGQLAHNDWEIGVVKLSIY